MEKTDIRKELGITNEEVISIQEIVFDQIKDKKTITEVVTFLTHAMADNPRLCLSILTNYVVFSDYFMEQRGLLINKVDSIFDKKIKEN